MCLHWSHTHDGSPEISLGLDCSQPPLKNIIKGGFVTTEEVEVADSVSVRLGVGIVDAVTRENTRFGI